MSEGQDKSHTLGASRTTQSPDLLGASLASHPRSTNAPRPEDVRVGGAEWGNRGTEVCKTALGLSPPTPFFIPYSGIKRLLFAG